MRDRDAQQVRWRLLALAYVALLIYASLFPFSGWTAPAKPFGFLAPAWPHHWRRVDILINVLAYVPLGLLLARWWSRRTQPSLIVLATLTGAALSFGVESLQQLLPSRVASLTDVVSNTLGTLAGVAVASFVRSDSLTGTAFTQWRERRFRPGRLADLGLIAIGIWMLSQLVPLVPSLDVGELRHGISPLWGTLHQPDRFAFGQWAAYAANIAGLALLARTLARPARPVSLPFFGFVACVLILKVPVIMRQLSLEAVAGAFAAAVLTAPMSGMRLKAIARTGAFFVLVGFVIAELAGAPTGIRHAFAWVPFSAQMENPLIGMASILENIWPAAALAYLIRFASPSHRRRLPTWIGGVALTALVFGLEWYQQFVPGRIGDITTVLLMAATWALFWMIPLSESTVQVEQQSVAPQPRAQRHSRTWILAGALILAATAAGALILPHRPTETRVDESKLPKLPPAADLPPVTLPGFRVAHPRLPSPTPAELSMLRTYNHDFLRQIQNRARGGKGEILQRRASGIDRTWKRGHEPPLPPPDGPQVHLAWSRTRKTAGASLRLAISALDRHTAEPTARQAGRMAASI